jgi:glycosyltransferase involved in cell wall biosynthesis
MANVLIIVENLPVPLDRRVWQEARALTRAGYGVYVICPKAGRYRASFEEIEGIRIFRHSLPMEGTGIIGYLNEYGWAWACELFLAVKIAVRYKVAVLQACNPPDNIFLIGIILRRLFGAKFVFDHHDPFAALFQLKFPRHRLIGRVASWFEGKSLRSADHVITTSAELRRMAMESYGIASDRITLVRSGFDLKRVPPLQPNPSVKRGRHHLALYIGVMGAQDGLNLLLEAAACVVFDHGRTDIQFVLAGGGSDMSAMQALCTKLNLDGFVEFSGYLEGKALYELLATASIGICPDPKNDFNDKLSMNKILEYMAFGLPIVQFDLTEGRLIAGDAALYAQHNDPKSMAEAIIFLIDNPAARDRMGSIGRARVADEFSWDKQEELYVAAYDRLTARERVPASAIDGDIRRPG